MFLPTTPKEVRAFGWQQLDVILISGDTYIDSPFTGVSLIGKLLVKHGFRVGIIAQPDINSDKDIARLGEPSLFWGITSGAVDSMVSNYTALKKRRKSDDYTPGGQNNRRPDRAVIAYSNLVRRYFKKTCPIVLGGIEASLRRICHYDFWSDSIRRSILFDAKADYLIYGMAESAVVELSNALKNRDSSSIYKIRGLCYISQNANPNSYNTQENDYITLPSYQVVAKDRSKFIESFNLFYTNNDPLTAKGLIQQQDSRYLIHNPPPFYPNTKEMDSIAALKFERDVHPYYEKLGKVKALDTIQFSISTHRGCYGECNFCSIAIHEGRTVRWRSESSIINEVKEMILHPNFKGIISDVGGPTANMYGFECQKKLKSGACLDRRCIFPTVCKNLEPDHSKLISLLTKIREIKGVRRLFVASGIRCDLIFSDQKYGDKYIEEVTLNHVSGQLKVAPEHIKPHILELMGKSDSSYLLKFKKIFDSLSLKGNKKQFLTYYLMAAHPGCTFDDMIELKKFVHDKLKITPEQIQIFTPTPSTYSTLMYYTEICPFTEKKLFVEKGLAGRDRQKGVILKKGVKVANTKKGVFKKND